MNYYQYYIAGPLFSHAELNYNAQLYSSLTSVGFTAFLPQHTDTKGMSAREIYESNLSALLHSNNMIAICDGADMDSGTAWEVGKFHGRGKIYALRTDFRQAADEIDTGMNLMIGQSADIVVNTIHELFLAISGLKEII